MNVLFQNKTTDGDSDIVRIDKDGYKNIKATGIFNGAVINLLCDYEDNDFAPMIEDNIVQTITVPGVLNIQPFKNGMRFKANLSGAVGGTDITLKLL